MFASNQQRQMFAPIARLLGATLRGVDGDIQWTDQDKLPAANGLNREFDHANNNHEILQFLPQDANLPYPQMAYEERIFKHGVIATRNNWHDFFNAMVWKRFPCIKSALNGIHHQEMLKQSGSVRSRKRDLLTLFDECGVIVVADQKYLSLIKNHQWQALFVDHQQAWIDNKINLLTFGHAMFEKYLQPYVGMTAQAMLLVNDGTFKTSSITAIDQYLGGAITDELLLTKKADLSPLPVLGIPGWHQQQDESFYANTNYFRPLREF